MECQLSYFVAILHGMHLSTLVEIAASLRARAGLTNPAYSTRQIIDSCFPDTLVTGRALPRGIDEAVSRTPRGIVIIYRRALPILEQRFAIAHALAHVIFDGSAVGCRPGSVGEPEQEERADAFASELLMPALELEPTVAHWPSKNRAKQHRYLDHADEIASKFQVPTGVVDKRIRELHALRNHIATSS